MNGKILVSSRISSFRWNLNSSACLLWGRNSMAKKILDSNKTAIYSLIGIATWIITSTRINFWFIY